MSSGGAACGAAFDCRFDVCSVGSAVVEFGVPRMINGAALVLLSNRARQSCSLHSISPDGRHWPRMDKDERFRRRVRWQPVLYVYNPRWF